MLLYLSLRANALHIEDPQCASVLWINQSMIPFYRNERLSKWGGGGAEVLESILERSGLSGDHLSQSQFLKWELTKIGFPPFIQNPLCFVNLSRSPSPPDLSFSFC